MSSSSEYLCGRVFIRRGFLCLELRYMCVSVVWMCFVRFVNGGGEGIVLKLFEYRNAGVIFLLCYSARSCHFNFYIITLCLK